MRRKRINCLPALSLYCLTIALFMAMDVAAVGSLGDIRTLLPWAILSWAIGGVFWSILHYSCWKALPEKYRATTPAKALGFLFIPLFNFYWAFVTFPKLASGFNALKRDRPELAIRNLRGVGFAYAISTVLVFTFGFFPGWGALVLLADLVLTFEFYLGVAANANLLVEGSKPIGMPTMPPSTSDELVPETKAVRQRLRLASAALFIAGCLCLGEFVLLGSLYGCAADWLCPGDASFLPVLAIGMAGRAGRAEVAVGSPPWESLSSGWRVDNSVRLADTEAPRNCTGHYSLRPDNPAGAVDVSGGPAAGSGDASPRPAGAGDLVPGKSAGRLRGSGGARGQSRAECNGCQGRLQIGGDQRGAHAAFSRK